MNTTGVKITKIISSLPLSVTLSRSRELSILFTSFPSRSAIKSPVLAPVRLYNGPEASLNNRTLGLGEVRIVEGPSDALEQLPHGTEDAPAKG